MAPTQPVSDTTEQNPEIPRMRSDAAWGLALGILGGLLLGSALHSSLFHAALLGAGFGLIFGSIFSKRASSAGAGLIWGLSSALLLWFLVLAISMMKIGGHDAGVMLEEARGRFPELAAYLLCLGAPPDWFWAFAGDTAGIPPSRAFV